MAATRCRKLALWVLEKQKRRQLTATLLLLVNQLFRLFYTRFTARLFGVASKRGKALFAPTPEQANDEEILELIKKRASISEASKVYKK